MRNDRPTLRGRFRDIDARLGSRAGTRSLAVALGALLAVQGGIVLDRSSPRPGSPEIAALEPADGASPSSDPFQLPQDGTGDVGAATTVEVVEPGDAGTNDDRAATDAAAPAPTDVGTAATAPPSTPTPPTTSGDASAGASTSGAQAAASPARQRFESRFPAQADAGQSTARPDTTRWAVLIGINEHSGRTRDNVGSRQDAEDLARHLRSLGWRDDHIVLLTDANATRENIVESFRWLQRKANGDSVVVVHYSGHVKQWHGRDADGDREIPDEAFWPSDNRFITDREVGDLLGKVRAQRLWFNVGGCEAAGFDDWGITGPNRIATYSSAEHQKSYEDPQRGNSVWGYYLFEEGMIAGHADANRDGNVTVEEAFRYATPRAHQRTRGQSHGPQTPEVSDRYQGEFDLRIPPPPRPRSEPEPASEDDGGSCLLCWPGDREPTRRR